jgi:ATP-binding cassette subfamily B protein
MRWLAGFVRPQAVRISAVLFLSFVATGLSLAQPFITRYLIDDGLLAGRMNVVLLLCAILLAAALLGVLLSGLNRWQYVDLSARVLFALRESVFSHLQRLSPAYYARARGGDVLQRLDGDVAEIQRFAIDALLSLVNGIIALAGTLVLMAVLSWKLSLLALVIIPAQLLFLRHMRPHVEKHTRSVRERASDVTSFIMESLGAMKLVQAVGGEARQSEALQGLHKDYRGDLMRQQMAGFVTTAVPGLLTTLSTAIVFIFGGWMVIAGDLSLGALIAFSIYMARASGPVQTLLGLYVATRRARVSLDRVLEIMNAPPAVHAPASPRPLPVSRFLCLFRRNAASSQRSLRGVPRRQEDRSGRRLGRGQVDPDRPVAPALRSRLGPHSSRRCRPAGAGSRRAAPPDRRRRPGHGNAGRQHNRQHPLCGPMGG